MNMTTKQLNQLIRGGARVRGMPKPSAANAKRVKRCGEFDSKTEAAYADRLEFMKRGGAIRDYLHHGFSLVLGKRCRYHPDFFVVESDGSFTFVEVKGFLRDDALVKFRAAQTRFPWFKFIMVSRTKNGWETIRE